MGCDIHLHGEVKIQGKWRHWSTPDLDRDYELFAKMAEVRNNFGIRPISPPKGIPEDASFETRFDYEDAGKWVHSASWLSAKEIHELGQFLKVRASRLHPEEFFYPEKLWGYVRGGSWGGVYRYPEEAALRKIEDVRFVFWFVFRFDN